MIKYLLICLLSLSTFASSKKVNAIKDQLSEKSLRVTKLAAKIRSLDKSIGENNRKYIETASSVKGIEQSLNQLKVELESAAKTVGTEFELINKIFSQYLLDRIDYKEKNKILKDRIYIETLSLQLKELEAAEHKSKELLESVSHLSAKFTSIRKTEQNLYDIIVALENDKRSNSEVYLNELEKKNSLRESLEKTIAKSKVKRRKKKRAIKKQYKISSFKNKSLILPLNGFKKFSGGKKGVTFTFDKVSPVLATSSGRVDYSGELASYGKIIMIDHGNGIRSLVLGDIKINVKKGDYVNKGQILAYTSAGAGANNKLYYELRKKNIAQNTLKILQEKKVL